MSLDSLTVVGRLRRWYLTRASHPLKDKIVGRYWGRIAGPRLWLPYEDGLVIRTGLTDYIEQKICFDGVYERVLVDWLQKNLRAEDIFWDVGANIGAMALIAAKRCKEVICFEPHPPTATRLKEHIRVNNLNNVRLLEQALSDHTGSAKLNVGPANNLGMNSMVKEFSGNCLSIQTVTADALVLEQRIPQPTVMKIDVEGAEKLVLRGAGKVLADASLRALIVEAEEGGDRLPADPEIVSLLQGAGLQITVLGKSDLETDDRVMNYLATR